MLSLLQIAMEPIKVQTNNLFEQGDSPRQAVEVSQATAVLADVIKKNTHSLLTGELGSGKSLVAAVTLMNIAGANGTRAFIASPTRDLSLSTRESMTWACGDTSEFALHIGGQDETTEDTSLAIGTTRVLWNDIIKNYQEYLTAETPYYSMLMFDETQTNTVEMYMTLGLVQRINLERDRVGLNPIKVVLASGTPNKNLYDHFSHENNQVELSGTSFDLEKRYLKPKGSLSAAEAIRTNQMSQFVDQIADYTAEFIADGTTLVLLPGIQEMRRLISRLGTDLISDDDIAIITGRTDPIEREEIYSHPPRLILATTTLENGVNIPGLMNVIESGITKTGKYRIGEGADNLSLELKTKAAILQAVNRTGRTGDGTSQIMLTSKEFGNLRPQSHPSVLHEDLRGYFVNLLAQGIDPITFVKELPGMEPLLKRMKDIDTRLMQMLDSLAEHDFIEFFEDGSYQLTADGELYAASAFHNPEPARLYIDAQKSGSAYTGEISVVAALFDRTHYFYTGAPNSGNSLEKLILHWNAYATIPEQSARYQYALDNKLVYQDWENAISILIDADEKFQGAIPGVDQIKITDEFLNDLNPLIVRTYFNNLMVKRKKSFQRIGSLGTKNLAGVGSAFKLEQYLISAGCVGMTDKSTIMPLIVHPVQLEDIIASEHPDIFIEDGVVYATTNDRRTRGLPYLRLN